jgi:D-alanyl-lipoteichoic acid acyltransferase DltB (MBOAT superfamily)
MSWKAEYIILIMISTLVDYIAGLQIYKSKSIARKKFFLIVSLFTNLGLLFAFKYFNFFSDSVRLILQQFAIPLNPFTLKVLLPVGISFYTFQTLSYTIDVYRGKIKPEKHLGIFAVYVSFFPQLVAGPIERAKNLLPQFFEKHNFDYKNAVSGARLMLWGFFKKMVIADNLAITVNMIYNNPAGYSGPWLIIATIFFAFQIYCDFSGYSDIAIGAARMMGFRLMQNFRLPYFAKSLNEFWKRWHISLSSWFRDYLYIPLGGSRVKVARWYVNILIVFVISGLWHGANWTFVVWGALHGIVLIIEKVFGKKTKDSYLNNFLKLSWTFLIVNIGWIFFRANNLSDAFYILTHIFTNTGDILLGGVLVFLSLIILFVIATFYLYIIKGWNKLNKPRIIRWLIYIIAILIIILFGITEDVAFIYFQF